MWIHGRLSAVVVLAATLAAAPRVMAVEPYVGLFVGAAIPQNSDIDPQLFNGTFHDVAFDTSILYGGKVGLYFDPVAAGLSYHW
jgi:hypothetical protein